MGGRYLQRVALTNNRLCALAAIGVKLRGEKHFLAIEDGLRESTQSWREVQLSLTNRGLTAPKLAIGEGAMGFWCQSASNLDPLSASKIDPRVLSWPVAA